MGQRLPWGSSGVWQQSFFGYIDELRIWNYTRNATQITADYKLALTGNEPGLVGMYAHLGSALNNSQDTILLRLVTTMLGIWLKMFLQTTIMVSGGVLIVQMIYLASLPQCGKSISM